MRNLLFLSHRFPYPPDRGEKIRAWNLIVHLAKSFRVFVGCLSDDRIDRRYYADLAAVCTRSACFDVDRRMQKMRSLVRYRPGKPLMLEYYNSPPLHRWVREMADTTPFDTVVTFSTAMAPYGLDISARRKILDMVDVDSEKWAAYAKSSNWPASLIWAREARTLLAYERRAAMGSDVAFLVTQAECERFVTLVPEVRERVVCLENGVDTAYFKPPATPDATPYADPGPWLAMVGNMDYWPNADAAEWFAREAMPLICRDADGSRPKLAIVGANPGRAVKALAALPDVTVTGRVEDVRSYLSHAAVVVAPLRIARGVQNKVLEGMAMARPVVASEQAFEGIRARRGLDLLVANGPEETARAVSEILAGKHSGLAAAGREAVERAYSWPAQLATLDRMLD